MISVQNDQEIRVVLTEYISKHILNKENVELVDFHQTAGGWSDETFVLSLAWTENQVKKEKGFVIRKAKDIGLTLGVKDLFPQYSILDKLSKFTNLPIPKVYKFENDRSILGNQFFIMEKLEGRSYVPWSKEGKRFFEKAAKGRIPEQFVTYLAELHNLNYKDLDLDKTMIKGNTLNYIDIKINELEEVYESYKFFDDPIITDAFEWLKLHKPNPIPLCIIHNDYRSGNLLYKDDEITGILDWEAAEVGDPRMDIAYVCAKANRMDSPLLSYLIEKDRFFEIYKEKAKLEFSDEDIFYFEVYHQLKFFMISLSAANAFIREGSTDLRMARQGFRLTLMKNMLAELLGY